MKEDKFLTPGTLAFFAGCAAVGVLLGRHWDKVVNLWQIATGGQPVCGGLLIFGMVLAALGAGLVIVCEIASQ